MKTSSEVQQTILGQANPLTTTKDQRTRLLLEQWRDENGEWEALFAVLRMANAWDLKSSKRLDQLVDQLAIAARIDELRVALLEKNKEWVAARAAGKGA